MQRTFAVPRSKRTDIRSHGSTMQAAKLQPVACVAVRPSESGVLNQEITVELERIAGRLVTDVVLEVHSVFVPAIAAYSASVTYAEDSDNVEKFRKRLESGENILGLYNGSAIAPCVQPMGIEPVKINGVTKLSAMPRFAHNVAVNFLRKNRYMYADEISPSNSDITPALLSSTALDRFNAVLSPEDRINGAVKLRGEVPVRGIGLGFAGAEGPGNHLVTETDTPLGQTETKQGFWIREKVGTAQDGFAPLFIEQRADADGQVGTDQKYPNIRADFALGSGQQLSLTDFMNAERQDELIRLFRAMVDQNPQLGEQMITRFIQGLNVEVDTIPYTVHERSVVFGQSLRRPSDGPSMDQDYTYSTAMLDYSAIIPKTEFGGCIITFITVKPEEVVQNQPDPIFSEHWHVDNFAADELNRIDPVPVKMRELASDVDQADEDVVAFYVGKNHMKANYMRADWTNDFDPSTLEHKSAVWRYPVPLSVTPSNILYPEGQDAISLYPFGLNGPTDHVASYWVKSLFSVQSPTVLGVSPLEELNIIDDENLLEDEE